MKKQLKVHAALFDNDGVLLDSVPSAISTLTATAERLGLRIPAPVEFRRAFGLHWESEMLPMLWPDDHGVFKDAYLKEYGGKLKFQPFHGLTDSLKDLKTWGIRLGVVTNRDRESTLRRFTEVGINKKWFTTITTSCDTPYRKPDPRCFDHALKKLAQKGIKVSETSYTGDTLIDVEVAQDIGMPFIGCTAGPCTREDFLEVGVPEHLIIGSPWEIVRILRPIS